MSGMGGTLQLLNPTVVAAFRSALVHQGIIALLIFFLLALLWVSVREWVPAARLARQPALDGPLAAEPPGRRVLRIGFGILWLLDGILQMQSAMPLGLPANVIQPSAASSPGWVRHIVDWGAQGWSYHPVSAAASAVWIQLGIGIWLLTATHGRWLRLGGLVSAGWGLVVWIFGEAFGGIFAPGLTWLFGAPGAALLYTVAGLLIALPPQAWRTARLGRLVLAGIGLFLTGMAVLQAWPGRGYWQGSTGNLADMVQGMSQTSQPPFLAALVRGFGSFTAGHGFAVNLVAVIALAAVGLAFLSGQRRVLRPAVLLLLVLCAADWLLIEDLGIFGGLGTDPNSMIPFALIGIGGYLALVSVPAEAIAAEPAPAGPVTTGPATTGPATTGPATTGPATTGPATTGPATTGPATTGPRRQPLPRPRWRSRLRPWRPRTARPHPIARPSLPGATGSAASLRPSAPRTRARWPPQARSAWPSSAWCRWPPRRPARRRPRSSRRRWMVRPRRWISRPRRSS